jgi:hypothetical protein
MDMKRLDGKVLMVTARRGGSASLASDARVKYVTYDVGGLG